MDRIDLARLEKMISVERLKPLLDLTKSTEKAIELHQDALRAGSALMTVIATVEIALRNTVCTHLTLHFAVSNWLSQTPVPFSWRKPESDKLAMALDSARRAAYAKYSQAQKHALDNLAYPHGRPPSTSHLTRSRKRRKYINVSEGQIIAELTFYFWKRLFGPDYEQALWRTALKRTFPNKKISRAEVAVQLEHIYQTRNRLAHHEPVLHGRFHQTMTAIEFVCTHLETQSTTDPSPLARLLATDVEKARTLASALHAKLDTYRIHS